MRSERTKEERKCCLNWATSFGYIYEKERFPEKHKCKLQPRGDGPFRVLEKINDNTDKIELPSEYGVSATFYVSDFFPFFNSIESRTTPFQEGEDDGTSHPWLLHYQQMIILHRLYKRIHIKDQLPEAMLNKSKTR